MSKTFYSNATLTTLQSGVAEYGLITNGGIAVENGRIAWCGDLNDAANKFKDWPALNLEGRLVTPGLIDCHTHLVYAGNRAKEFEQRLQGASYEELNRAGGGIMSTVRATREATEDDLVSNALRHVDSLIAEGVTTIEIKSGYGLDIETELKMLRAARSIPKLREVQVRTSFLGAHTIPPEYSGKPELYLSDICMPALQAANEAGLVDAVDGFCESIAFNTDQIENLFIKARELGLPVKLHAEQLSNMGAAKLAASYAGLSADHLEYLDSAGIKAMVEAGTVAVLLPGACYSLRETKLPPIDEMRKHSLPMAVATDCNPGSSPLSSILLAMNMACTLFRLTPQEALAGVTYQAARALGLSDRGMIKPGLRADLAIWNAEHPAELSYRIGFNPLYRRVFGN